MYVDNTEVFCVYVYWEFGYFNVNNKLNRGEIELTKVLNELPYYSVLSVGQHIIGFEYASFTVHPVTPSPPPN